VLELTLAERKEILDVRRAEIASRKDELKKLAEEVERLDVERYLLARKGGSDGPEYKALSAKYETALTADSKLRNELRPDTEWIEDEKKALHKLEIFPIVLKEVVMEQKRVGTRLVEDLIARLRIDYPEPEFQTQIDQAFKK